MYKPKHGIDVSSARFMTGRDYVRELVRTRDKYICQQCGKKWRKGMRRFDIHHLDGKCGEISHEYDSVNKIDKLITFCHKCHFNHISHSQRILGKYGNKDRYNVINQLRKSGLSYSDIGKKFGITRQRVHQIHNNI